MASAFQEWLQQGEHLYNTALREFHDIERQLGELETRLAEKQTEVNQIAQIIGRPMVEGNRRLTAQLVSSTEIVESPDRDRDRERVPTPGANANIARALTGKFGR